MTVLDQLKEYCDCIDVKDTDVDELIHLISVQTCWADGRKVCDTFLLSDRREVRDLPDCICDCDVFKFDPHYYPFDPDSFTFTLIEQDGLNETATPITDFVYSAIDENFRIDLPIPDCKCGCNIECGCKPNYKLLVTYTAGYEEIPECLLPLMCEALQWIKHKNTCDCAECEPCQNDSTERKYYEIDYTTLTGRLQDYFLETLKNQYVRQLSMISICDRVQDMWVVVV